MNEEHKELQESARQVMSGLGVGADEDTSWAQFVELGWLYTAVPEEAGGLGLGLSGACALYLEQGRGLGSAPFMPAMLALDAVIESKIDDKDAWLERLMSGTLVAAPLAPQEVAFNGDCTSVSGRVAAVLSADKAEHVLLASDDCVALAPLTGAGVTLETRATWDKTRRLFDVTFESVAIDPRLVLARGAAAQSLASKLAMHTDFALAADSVGGAEALLEQTVEYLQTRKQFGRPIAMFQALKHRCADLKALCVASEALLIDCLNRADSADETESARLGMMAKQFACFVYSKVAEESVQLHGGIAMTSEYPCHLYLKRALLNEALGRPADSYGPEIAAPLLA